jgi:WNK lysine deficient protein kinase
MNRKELNETIADPFEGRIIDANEVVARSEAMLAPLEPSGGQEKQQEEGHPRYKRLQSLLGEGAFKRVYKAIDQEEGKEVAWNEIRMAERGYDAKERMAFSNEIALLKSINHPNIIKIFDYWFANENLVFITELMTGGTLREYIAEIREMNIRLIKKWGRQILDGLVHLHGQSPPIIHRDIKCENIFVNAAQGEVKIGDLGVAKEKRMKRYTVVGTPQFMAREMFEGEGYSEKVDVYAFGMCLIEMATGMYPYRECLTAAEVYKAILQGVPPVVLDTIKDICLRNLIMNCIVAEKDRLTSRDCLKHHFFDAENTCSGECIPAECITVVPLTAPANDMEISLLSFKDNVITFQLFFMSMARFIKFDFDLEADTVEDVANEMMEEEVVSEEQRNTLLTLLSRGIQKAREGAAGIIRCDDEEVTRGVEQMGMGVEDKGSGGNSGTEAPEQDTKEDDDSCLSSSPTDSRTVTECAPLTLSNDCKCHASKSPPHDDLQPPQEQARTQEAPGSPPQACPGAVHSPAKSPPPQECIHLQQMQDALASSATPPLDLAAISTNSISNSGSDSTPSESSFSAESTKSFSPPLQSSSMCCPELFISDPQKKQLSYRAVDGLEVLAEKYKQNAPIEEFSADVAAAIKRSPETAGNWTKVFKSNDIDSVSDLRILVDEDWDKLGLTVFSSRAMKNILFGVDKVPLKEKQLPTNTLIKDYEDVVEIRGFLGEVAQLIEKTRCATVWENRLLAQDIRTVGELRSLHQDDWDRLGLSAYSYRIIKNAIYKKGKITDC